MAAYGVLPSLLDNQSAGPALREGERHTMQYQLQPIAELVAQEASDKLGTEITMDTLQPVQAYDAGARSRALRGAVQALAEAKQAGLDGDSVAAALKFAGMETLD
jgi:hypothetical protein